MSHQATLLPYTLHNPRQLLFLNDSRRYIGAFHISARHTTLTVSSQDALGFWCREGSVVPRVDATGESYNAKAEKVAITDLTRAALYLLPPDSGVLQDLLNECSSILRDVKTDGLPWDVFNSQDETGRTYATSKVCSNLGPHLHSVVDDPQVVDRAIATLSAYVKATDLPGDPASLPLVYWSVRGLAALDALEPDTSLCAGQFAQQYILGSVARRTLDPRVPISPVLFAVALLLDSGFSPNPLAPTSTSAALRILFEECDSLVNTARYTILRAGTHAVGLSAFEVLLGILEEPRLLALMDEFAPEFDAVLGWLDDHANNVEYNEATITLYQSDVFPTPTQYDAWFNGLAHLYRATVAQFQRRRAQSQLVTSFRPPPKTPTVTYDNIVCGGFEWPQRFREQCLRQINADGTISNRSGNGVILFGPPGTGKTTLAQLFAHELPSWVFIRLTSTDFLTNGYENIPSTARHVFDRLQQLDRAIVFFDEFELLLSDRGRAGTGWAESILTTVMLPAFQELHDHKTVFPIIATNHITRLDPAGRRPGRFDYVLPVGLPNEAEREALIRSAKLPESHRIENLARICDRGRVSDIMTWCRLYEADEATYDCARRHWDENFRSLADTTDARQSQSEFEEAIPQYGYPKTWCNQA